MTVIPDQLPGGQGVVVHEFLFGPVDENGTIGCPGNPDGCFGSVYLCVRQGNGGIGYGNFGITEVVQQGNKDELTVVEVVEFVQEVNPASVAVCVGIRVYKSGVFRAAEEEGNRRVDTDRFGRFGIVLDRKIGERDTGFQPFGIMIGIIKVL